MLSCAIAFIAMALVATALGFSGIAGAATDVVWILALVGLVVGIELSLGRRPIGTSLTRKGAGESLRRDPGDSSVRIENVDTEQYTQEQASTLVGPP
jgi:uncharacterized membrane protein YtjA (UPF0391 family)